MCVVLGNMGDVWDRGKGASKGEGEECFEREMLGGNLSRKCLW